MFCCALLYVVSSFAIILMEKRELIALLRLSSWCFVIVVWLFLAVQWFCLQFVIVVFPDHTHLLFLRKGLYFLDDYNEPKITNKQLKTSTLTSYRVYVLLDITFQAGLHMSLLTSIYSSILKLIASKFQEMLLRYSTLQT